MLFAFYIFNIVNEFSIESMVAHGFFVAKDYEFHFGSCHGNVHAAEVREEADLSAVVVAYEAYEYDVAFLTLETIDGADSDGMAERAELFAAAQLLAYVACLHPIGRDNANIEAFV